MAILKVPVRVHQNISSSFRNEHLLQAHQLNHEKLLKTELENKSEQISKQWHHEDCVTENALNGIQPEEEKIRWPLALLRFRPTGQS